MKHRFVVALSNAMTALTFAALTCAGQVAWAQPTEGGAMAAQADIAALIEHENWPARLTLLRSANEQQLEVALSSPAWAGLSPEQRTTLLADLRDYMDARFAWPGDMRDMILKAYQENASQSDVKTLSNFYASPDGQWLLQRFQAKLDKVEQKLQLDARTLITAWSNEVSVTPTPAPYEPKSPTAWRPEGTHATQCAHALAALVKQDWSRQLIGIKLAANDRFSRLVGERPDRKVRQLAFQDRIRHEITYEAFEPSMVAALCAELSEPEIARGLAIEQSPARKELKPIEARLGQAFGRRMQAWQQQVLMPGLGQRMQDARKAAAGQLPTR